MAHHVDAMSPSTGKEMHAENNPTQVSAQTQHQGAALDIVPLSHKAPNEHHASPTRSNSGNWL